MAFTFHMEPATMIWSSPASTRHHSGNGRAGKCAQRFETTASLLLSIPVISKGAVVACETKVHQVNNGCKSAVCPPNERHS